MKGSALIVPPLAAWPSIFWLLSYFIVAPAVLYFIGADGAVAATVIAALLIPAWALTFFAKYLFHTYRVTHGLAATALQAYIGAPPQWMDFEPQLHGGHLSIAGMAYANGRIYIIERGHVRDFAIQQVVGWSTDINGIHNAHWRDGRASSGPINGFHAQGSTAFTLHLSDQSEPVWWFLTSDDGLPNRWAAFLNSTLDGAPTATADSQPVRKGRFA